MIWSLIKLVAGVIILFTMLIGNCLTWLFNFHWDKNLFTLFFTDKNDGEEGIQYYYHGNVLAWAFKIKRLADDSFDMKNRHKPFKQ